MVNCKFPKLAQCGDGAWDSLTEECDAGMLNGDYPNAPCRSNCTLPRCGDGIVDTSLGEECDAGNNLDGPDCFADCTLPRRAAENPSQVAASLPSGTASQGGAPSTQIPVLPVPQGREIVPSSIPTPARTATGPGLVIFLASGAAAGVGLVRRRLKGE
jgi:hypothetical protein